MVRPGLDAGNAAELTEAPIGADETGAGSAPKGCETRAERTGYQVGRPLECGAETTGGNAAWSSSNEMWINRRSVLEMLRRRLTAELSGLEMRRDFCDSKRRDAFAGPLQRIVRRHLGHLLRECPTSALDTCFEISRERLTIRWSGPANGSRLLLSQKPRPISRPLNSTVRRRRIANLDS